MAALRSLGLLLRDGVRLDRTQSDPVVAARNTVGVVLPLVIGAANGAAGAGLPASIGALQTAFADRPGPYRLRLARMGLCALASAVMSGLAVALSAHTVGSVVLITVAAFAAGMMLAAGPSAAQVGIACTASALVLGHQVERPGLAIHVALLVLAGGMLQAVLAIAAWPLRRHGPERRALAGLYRQLADVARQPPSASAPPALTDQVQAVRLVFYGYGHDHGPSVEAYRVLFDEAARLRREVILLAGYAHRLDRQNRPDSAASVRQLLVGVAGLCDEIAAALEQARAVSETVLEPVRANVKSARAALAGPADESAAMTELAAAARIAAVSGQLRAAVEAAGDGGAEGATGETRRTAPGQPALRAPFDAIRANLTFASPVFRHAMRLAVVVGGSDLVTHLAGVQRGYWVPLTVLVVLRPDFGATFQRSVLRIVGTIVGLLVATGLVHLLPSNEWYLIALIGLFVFGFRLAGPLNVAQGALCLAALVVLLLTLAGVTPRDTVAPRAIDTLIGGGLALLAVLAWPVWERGLVRQRLRELLAAYRRYLAEVADPATELPRLRSDRSTARLARTAALASVDRARAEPVPAHSEVELGESVLANSHRLIQTIMTLDALRPALREHPDTPELSALLDAATTTLGWVIDALDGSALPAGSERAARPDSLRPLQETLFAALRGDADRFGGAEVAATVADATDRLANSVDTIVSVVRPTREGGGSPPRASASTALPSDDQASASARSPGSGSPADSD